MGGRIGAHTVLQAHLWGLVVRQRVSSVCTAWFDADGLMKLRGSIWVVRMRCGICTDLVLWCFDNPEGLSYEKLLVGVIPELSSWLTVTPWCTVADIVYLQCLYSSCYGTNLIQGR
jgi:hypothetical protein